MRITHLLNTVLWFINSALWLFYTNSMVLGFGFGVVAGVSLWLLFADN